MRRCEFLTACVETNLAMVIATKRAAKRATKTSGLSHAKEVEPKTMMPKSPISTASIPSFPVTFMNAARSSAQTTRATSNTVQ